MADPLPHLRVALEHLEKATLAPALASALDALLEAWRVSGRPPAIADAIDRVSDTLTRNEPIIATAKSAWYAALEAKRSARMGRLLESLPEGADRAPRPRVLVTRPPDPRVGTFARRWLETPPVTARNRAPFYLALAKLLEHTGDVRLTGALLEIADPSAQEAATAKYGQGTWAPLVAVARTLAETQVPALSEEARAVLVRIDAILRQPATAATSGTSADVAELFTHIYAEPDDDEARAVLADLLQQHGDPRGEFIALQLARHGTDRPPTREEQRLQLTWGRTWLGGMEPLVAKEGLVFERGFATRIRYAPRNRMAAALEAPEWATVTHVDATEARAVAPLLDSPAARAFRHVIGIGVNEVETLRKTPRPWETIGFWMASWVQRGPLEAGSGAAFEAARTLILSCTSLDGLNGERQELTGLVSRWPNVRVLDIALGTSSFMSSLVEELGTVQTLTVRARDATTTFDRATRAFTAELHRVNEYELLRIRETMQRVGARRADVRISLIGSFDGERLRLWGGEARTAPLVDAARRDGIALTIQGVTITSS